MFLLDVFTDTLDKARQEAEELVRKAAREAEELAKKADEARQEAEELVRKAAREVEAATREVARKAEEEAKELAKKADEAAKNLVQTVENLVDTSKGVDYFTYLSGQNFKVAVSSRGNDDKPISFEPKNNLVGKMQKGHCEISRLKISANELTGKFSLEARKNDGTFLSKSSKYAEINPVTGNLGESNIKNMLETPSIVEKDFAISYGFYDAGKGLDSVKEGLDNIKNCLADKSIECFDFSKFDFSKGSSHQAYMYVTDNYSNWMSQLIREMPQLNNKPFGTFVLPGSHDAGMFTGLDNDEAARTLIKQLILFYGRDYKAIAAAIGGAMLLGPLVISALANALIILENTSLPKRSLINLAYTQKDDIKTQLELGIRYFDFRPGYNASFYKTDDKLRHQHCFIPGYEFDKFLSDVVSFLKTHDKEIVVVNVKYSGFLQKEMKPSPEIITSYIDRSLLGSGITKGNVNDLNKTVTNLLETKTRVIFLYNLDEKSNDNSRDSYNDNYATNEVNTIIQALDSTFKKQEENWTVLQLQGTSNATPEGLIKALLTLSDASSPLLSTKAQFDCATYDWVSTKENVASRCGEKLLVLLNDFVDNALVSHSMAITRQRLGIN
jgi:vacuolar-type H+-ATPase subunit H